MSEQQRTAIKRNGGRPSKGERRVLYARIPVDLYDRVMAEAEARDISANRIAEKALASFLDRLTPIDDGLGNGTQDPTP